MIDIEHIRQNADLYRTAARTKRVPLDVDRLLAVDKDWRGLKNEVDGLRRERNILTEQIGANGDGRADKIAQAKLLGERLKDKETDLNLLEAELDQLMALAPGLPADDVPEGATDADNVPLRFWSNPRHFDFTFKDHLELAHMHKMVNLDGAREIAGSRAYALTGAGALLELAVLNFALQFLMRKGFTAVVPPLLVNEKAMFGTGYFPLGEDNAYHLEHDKLFLTGTSEVGTVAMHADKLFDAQELPLRFAGISACFRREAGAAGRDTKGFYRVHQFQKVEQVVFCENDPLISAQEHEALLANAEEILQALELPYRVVAVCTGDMGLGQIRKHDIETWMPSRNAFCETHSCSTFHDFQARRLNIKCKDGDGRRRHVHTLNNTAIASPRILIALIENHQNEDGTINVPKALRPFLGGLDLLVP